MTPKRVGVLCDHPGHFAYFPYTGMQFYYLILASTGQRVKHRGIERLDGLALISTGVAPYHMIKAIRSAYGRCFDADGDGLTAHKIVRPQSTSRRGERPRIHRPVRLALNTRGGCKERCNSQLSSRFNSRALVRAKPPASSIEYSQSRATSFM